jgi:hypothetical protein
MTGSELVASGLGAVLSLAGASMRMVRVEVAVRPACCRSEREKLGYSFLEMLLISQRRL